MSKKHSPLLKNIFSLTIVQLITYLSPIIILPYLSRTLSIENFGLAMLIMSIIIISILVTDFGFNLYSPSWIAKNRESKNKISTHVSTILVIKSGLFLLVSIMIIIFFIFSNISFENINGLLIATLLAILSQTFQIIWFFQGIEKMLNITLLTFFSKLSYILFVLITVHNPDDVINVILSYAASNFIATIIGLIIFHKIGFSIIISKKNDIFETMKISFPFFLSRAAISTYTSASTMIIGSIAGLSQAALYSSAEKLYQAGQSVAFPISQALYPYLSRTKNILTFYRFMLILIPPLIFFVAIIYIYSTDIIILFYGNNYSAAAEILKIFLFTTVVSFISVNFGYPAFSMINRLDIANKSVMAGAFIQLTMLIILYLKSDITPKNIALSILITESTVMAIRIIFFIKISKGMLDDFK